MYCTDYMRRARTYRPNLSSLTWNVLLLIPFTNSHIPGLHSLRYDWMMDLNRPQQEWVFPPADCLNGSPYEQTQYTPQGYSCVGTLQMQNAGDNQIYSYFNEVRPWILKFPYRMFIFWHTEWLSLFRRSVLFLRPAESNLWEDNPFLCKWSIL